MTNNDKNYVNPYKFETKKEVKVSSLGLKLAAIGSFVIIIFLFLDLRSEKAKNLKQARIIVEQQAQINHFHDNWPGKDVVKHFEDFLPDTSQFERTVTNFIYYPYKDSSVSYEFQMIHNEGPTKHTILVYVYKKDGVDFDKINYGKFTIPRSEENDKEITKRKQTIFNTFFYSLIKDQEIQICVCDE